MLRTLLLSFSLQTAFFLNTKADIYPVEVFDYTSGELLSSTKEAEGWTTGWMANAELTEELDDDYLVAAESLTSAAYEQHGLRPVGGKFVSLPTGKVSSIYRGMEVELDWSAEADDLYLSYLVRWEGNHPTESSRVKVGFGEALDSAQSKSGFVRCFVALHGTGSADEMRLVLRNGGKTIRGEESYLAGETYLVVVRISTYSGSEPDVMSAVVFGPEDTVPTEAPEDWELTLSQAANGRATTLEFSSQLYHSGRLAELDELRFGPTWSSVTAAQ